PYVDRALRDEELREHVREAYLAARAIYDDVVAPRGVTAIATRLAGDHEVQANLRRGVMGLPGAAGRLHEPPPQHKGRGAVLIVTGILIGLLFNPMTGADTRRWLKEKLFGADDEFGYESPLSGNGSTA